MNESIQVHTADIRAAAKAAAIEDGRYALSHVHVAHADGRSIVESTDGKVAIRIMREAHDAFHGTLLPAKSCKDVWSGKLPNARIVANNLTVTYPAKTGAVTVTLPELRYPPIADVVPSYDPSTPTVRVGAAYLAKIAAAIQAATGAKESLEDVFVSIHVTNAGKPIVMTATSKDGADIVALLMPVTKG